MNGVGSLRETIAYDEVVEGKHYSHPICAFNYCVCCDVSVVSMIEANATKRVVDECVVENGVSLGAA